MKIEIIEPMICAICGQKCGKSNLTFNNVEIYIACNCWPKTKIAFFDLNKIRWEGGLYNLKTGSFDYELLEEL